MIEAEILPVDQWHLVAPIVTGEFNNAMPDTPRQAIFLALREGDRLLGFTQMEVLLNVNSMWVTPELRHGRTVWQLMRASDDLLRSMPGFSAVVFSHGDRQGNLLSRLGGRHLGVAEIWRKDY